MSEIRQQNFRLAAGADKTVRVTMEASPLGGVAAWTMRFRLYSPAGGLLLTVVAPAVVVVNPTTGVWDIFLAAADTALAAGEYGYDFWRTDVGAKSPVAYGTCEVYRGISPG